ncbi:hypothetical protein M514_23483 [Trichuris suis]|uniref:Uncharacterized protein n=1 Tax=Trichuris suis TaxID=68888 RepID=A0A085N4B9_9BILA|nr:hypothetical protein M514_23483 [Trichuris suis]
MCECSVFNIRLFQSSKPSQLNAASAISHTCPWGTFKITDQIWDKFSPNRMHALFLYVIPGFYDVVNMAVLRL